VHDDDVPQMAGSVASNAPDVPTATVSPERSVKPPREPDRVTVSSMRSAPPARFEFTSLSVRRAGSAENPQKRAVRGEGATPWRFVTVGAITTS
jgi:hypothetical protein